MGNFNVATGLADNDDADIEILDLSVRGYNSLKRNGVNTVRQLLALRKRELHALRHLNPKTIAEIQERLIAHRFLDAAHLSGPFAEDDEPQDV